ncbi:carbon storage regulator [Bremerella cremea]|uniref:Translational regulator CsrA n=1 Tax=Blastopirellula marina TaxID=124 RepID=A0A2S8FS59_9BACT|nr:MULTISPECIES: carbon storage regulator CsrA [Pirellulaceae]PQO35018.1 carbon storage regulator [Blastopirellula marina]RCS47519.1 carbon storage regulator [Bremerella cremea]
MLVLSRKIGDSIKVGDDVEIVVLQLRGDKVRLGIEAPKSVEVHRREVWAKIQGEDPEAGDDVPRSPAA